MHRKARKIKALLSLLILLSTGGAISFAVADPGIDEEIFTIKGLSFKCERCLRVSEQDCEIIRFGKPFLLPCEDVPQYLLTELAQAEYTGLHPSADELYQFLLSRNDLSAPLAYSTLKLVMKTARGKDLLAENLGAVLPAYGSLLLQLMQSKEGGGEFWQRLFRASFNFELKPSYLFRAKVLSFFPEIGFGALVKELSVKNSKSDLRALEYYAEAFSDFGSGFYTRTTSLHLAIKGCQQILTTGHIPDECSLSELQKQEGSIAEYLQRLQMQLVLSYIESRTSAPLEALTLLSQTNTSGFRTLAVHREIEKQLKKALTSLSSEQQGELLQGSSGQLLFDIREHDSELAALHDELRASVSGGGSLSLLVVILLLAAGVAGGVIFRLKRKINSSEELADAISLNSFERSELRNLLGFFELPGFCSSDELAAAYRRKAKVIHPDASDMASHSSSDATGDFSELSCKYKRAQELLTRREV